VQHVKHCDDSMLAVSLLDMQLNYAIFTEKIV